MTSNQSAGQELEAYITSLLGIVKESKDSSNDVRMAEENSEESCLHQAKWSIFHVSR